MRGIVIGGTVFLVAAILFGEKAVYIVATYLQRGLRNNNPGNIRLGEQWQGMAEAQSDPEYIVFKTPVYGLRAMARVLDNYRKRYGLNTIQDIVTRWAPHSENPTDTYADFVAKKVGVSPTSKIDTADTMTMAKLIAAMVSFENGLNPYDNATILEGIAAARA